MLLRAMSPFLTQFSILKENFLPFSSNFKLLSANSFSLEESKFCHSLKGSVLERQPDGGKDRKTKVKQYAPDLSGE